MFKILNLLIAKFTQHSNFSRYLYIFFARILPVPTKKLRGVPIKIVIPLNHLGVYDSINKWETREPETLDWIDKFEQDSIFFDIGSNFGNETLYSALKRNPPKKIVSFDIDLNASFMLAYNILLNKIKNVEQYFVGVSGKKEFINYEQHTNFSCVKDRPKYDKIGLKTFSISIDEFISERGIVPNYIKIDVDGIENQIVSGMDVALDNPDLKSVLIEVDDNTKNEVIKFLNSKGWDSVFETDMRGVNTYNIIFQRYRNI